MTEVTATTKKAATEKIKKSIDFGNARVMALIGVIVSFFVPILGSVLALIGLKQMNKAKEAEEKAYNDLSNSYEERISAAKKEAAKIVDGHESDKK